MKKTVFNILSIIFLAWILAGGPTGYTSIKPLQPDPRAPIFGEVDPIREQVKEDIEEGNYTEAPDDVEKREAFLEAFYLLRDDPCDKKNREAYAELLRPMMNKHLRWEKKGEDPYQYALWRALNKDVYFAIEESIKQGYVLKSDLPWRFRFMFGDMKPACHPDIDE